MLKILKYIRRNFYTVNGHTRLNKATKYFFRYAYSLNRDSGITTGLDGAIQRLIVNGDVMDDLVIHAKDSRGITRYVGPPCNDVDDPAPKCQNGGICRPYFRAYVCKCSSNYMGRHCEKGYRIFMLNTSLQGWLFS